MLIALTICTMLSQPTCTDETIPLGQVQSPIQCMRDGPAIVAQWMTEHFPDQRVSQWKCVASEDQKRRT